MLSLRIVQSDCDLCRVVAFFSMELRRIIKTNKKKQKKKRSSSPSGVSYSCSSQMSRCNTDGLSESSNEEDNVWSPIGGVKEHIRNSKTAKNQNLETPFVEH